LGGVVDESSSNLSKIRREVMDIAREIPDAYVRAITLARIGYLLKRKEDSEYKRAFSWALSAVGNIENPLLMLKAMIEVSRYLYLSGMDDKSRDVIQSAYESALLLKGPARDVALEEIALGSLFIGRPDDALFYATDIQDTKKKDETIAEVVRAYLRSGNIRKASSLLDSISSPELRSRLSFAVIKKHLERGEFASAMRLLPRIESDYWLDISVEAIAKKLAENDVPAKVYEKFVEAMKELSNSRGRDYLTTFLVGISSRVGGQFVARVVNALERNFRLGVAKGIIGTLLSQPTELYGFLEVLALPPEEFDVMARDILDKLLKEAPSEIYHKVVLLIGKKTEDESVLVKIVTYLSKLGSLDEAMVFAKQIVDPYLRSLAFGAIAIGYLKKGDVGKAIDAVAEVHDREWGSWLMGEVLVKVLESGVGESAEEELGERAKKHRELRRKFGS
jgi:tetratricopeptide (TPR) repeat protein